MSNDLAKLVVRLEAETAKYQKELEKANAKTKKWEKSTKKSVGNIKSLIAGVSFGLVARAVIQATVKQEAALAQLEARLKSTGGTVGFTKNQLADFASELQNVSTYGDEDLIGAMSQLATFTNITGQEFKDATVAIADLSTAMGQDLKSSVLQLGKALNDPIGNLSALSRAGIQFSDDQEAIIKSLAKTGDMAGAQRVILKELETQFGGSAKAARETFGGALKGLENAFGDLLEGDSGLSEAGRQIESLTTLLADPAVKQGITSLASAIVSSFSGAISVVASVGQAVKFMAEEFASFLHGPAFDDPVRRAERIFELEKKVARLRDVGAVGVGAEMLDLYEKELAGLKALEKDYRSAVLEIEPPPSKGANEDAKADVPPQFKFIADPEKLATYEQLLSDYATVSENSAAYIEDVFANAFNNIANNIGNTLATAIIEGENLGDAFKQVGKTLVTDMLSGLIKVGAQMAINALFAETTQATLVAANIVSGQAVAAAWAPAAAFTSLASFGANSVPAQTGIATTVGLSNSLAIAGMAHDGIDNIPREGTWLLDGGERVLSPNQNADLSAFLESQTNGSGETKNFHFDLSGKSLFDTNTVRELLEAIGEEMGDRMNVRVITV